MPPLRVLVSLLCVSVLLPASAETLPGTKPLTVDGDLSVQMVEGIHRWLAQARKKVDAERVERWRRAAGDARHWDEFAKARRSELAVKIGAVDERRSGALVVEVDPAEAVKTAQTGGYLVRRVSWPVFDGVNGEGLILQPAGPAKAAVIVVPDADQTPEQVAGIQPGVERTLQLAREFAERGFLVLVPTLVDRRDVWSGSEKLKRFTNAPHREWIHRQSFESGRTLVGYEVHKILAAVDALRGPSAKLLADGARVGVVGYGEGGLLALHAAAIDPRIDAVWTRGYLGAGESDELIYRSTFGKRVAFSDAELAALIAPRAVGVSRGAGPPIVAPSESRDGRKGAAPGSLESIAETDREAAIERATEYRRQLGVAAVEIAEDPGAFMERVLGVQPFTRTMDAVAQCRVDEKVSDERQRRTIRELEDWSQRILRESEFARKATALWSRLKPGAEWEAVQKQARAEFWENVIGKLSTDYLPPNPRSRLAYDREKWRGYDVMLDVQPDIFAWGVLLVPKDLKPGERRPVVVCQHGLEGLPEDTIVDDPQARAWRAYKSFAPQLCERGFVVYAPHNPYRGGDSFRRIQREANPLGLSLFSFIIAQHDVTTRWLASLPFVDPERIAFYGLSYGGKTAMRVPAVLERYCLSICSGDFNDWVVKCASNTLPMSYVFTGEWEIWEWNFAHTFNYAEMALLIAPRPFMVERGHDDGVALDENVGYEWAKVRRGYDKLGISDRAEIEWFDGPHTIHGDGTFKFLHKWLRWPDPAK